MGTVYLLSFPVIFFIIISLLQYLWNTTMPELFDLKQITFWQSFRLLLISAILFKASQSIFSLLGLFGLNMAN